MKNHRSICARFALRVAIILAALAATSTQATIITLSADDFPIGTSEWQWTINGYIISAPDRGVGVGSFNFGHGWYDPSVDFSGTDIQIRRADGGTFSVVSFQATSYIDAGSPQTYPASLVLGSESFNPVNSTTSLQTFYPGLAVDQTSVKFDFINLDFASGSYNLNYVISSVTVESVPEPANLVLLSLGLCALLGVCRRK